MTMVEANGKNAKSGGFILITSLLMLAMLSILGVAAISTSNVESMISRNQSFHTEEFYSAEAGLIHALEKSDQWFTAAFAASDPSTAKAVFTSTVQTGRGSVPVTVEIRCIDSPKKKVSGLSKEANDVPLQPHVGPPPPGSGFGMNDFIIKRYAVTVTSQSGDTKIQAGVWRAFPK